MPRGIHKDAAHLHDILEKGVILDKDRVEGSVDLGDEGTVYVGVMFDVEGYGPHVGALYVTQGYGSSDESLQAADQMLEEWLLDHHGDALEDLEKEYGEDAMSVFTETFDGFAFELSPHDFVEAIRGTDAEKYIDVEEDEEEEPESVREAPRREAPRARESVDDPFYIVQGLYDDGYIAAEGEGTEDEREAIRQAESMARASWFEGDYVRVITRDGDFVWDSREGGVEESPGVSEGAQERVEAMGNSTKYDFFRRQGLSDEGAWDLAAAEQEAENRGWEVTWEDDPEGWDSLGDIDPSTVREVLWAALRDEEGTVLESLGSIVDPDRSYGRQVEAELAYEALTREGWKPPSRKTRGGRRASEESLEEARRGPTRLDRLRSSLPKGYSVFTWSPGDGVTRYRFFHNAPPSQDYFGPNNGIYTALGFAQAEAYADGLGGGMHEAPVAEETRRRPTLKRPAEAARKRTKKKTKKSKRGSRR